jgi:DNA-binding transcriptional regulator YdaS (Cro superfamily)
MKKNPALKRAVAKFDSIADMARQMGVSYQAVQDWIRRGRVPADRCVLLSKLTGESREDLVGWPPSNIVDRAEASDDVQPPAGGTSGDEKLAKMVA